MRFEKVAYLRWAKSVPGAARWRLTASGVRPPPPGLLGDAPDAEEVAAAADGGYGHRAVARAIAAAYGVDHRGVVVTGGTSEANFLALAALLGPGDRVGVETPVYGPLLSAVRALGAVPIPVPRRPERAFAVDPDDVRAALRRGVRAVLLTRLHNPSGVDLPARTLEEVAAACRGEGAILVVDEVYRDFLGERAGPVAATLGEGVVTTSSLTKVYGLGALRIGWALCAPALAERLWDVRDHLEVLTPAPSIAWALRAFGALDALRERAIAQAEEGRARVEAWLASRPHLSWVPPDAGICGALRLPPGTDDRAFCARLLRERETAVVPGSFFDLPGWVRIGWAEEPAHVDEALGRLGEGLEGLSES